MSAAPLSILALARRLNAASVLRLALASKKTDGETQDETCLDRHTSRLLDECCALQEVIVASTPADLMEAAIQGAMLFYAMDEMMDEDEAFALSVALKKVQYTLGGIVRVLVKEAALDLSQIGETDIASYLDHHSPPPAAGVGALA
jgi:hypothetical protein